MFLTAAFPLLSVIVNKEFSLGLPLASLGFSWTLLDREDFCRMSSVGTYTAAGVGLLAVGLYLVR